MAFFPIFPPFLAFFGVLWHFFCFGHNFRRKRLTIVLRFCQKIMGPHNISTLGRGKTLWAHSRFMIPICDYTELKPPPAPVTPSGAHRWTLGAKEGGMGGDRITPPMRGPLAEGGGVWGGVQKVLPPPTSGGHRKVQGRGVRGEGNPFPGSTVEKNRKKTPRIIPTFFSLKCLIGWPGV